MIKKISQLNRLPTDIYNNEDKMSDDKILFEVSHKTNDEINSTNANELNYYTSYSINLNGAREILGVNNLSSLLNTIANGGLSVTSNNLSIGVPGEGEYSEDRISEIYHPNNDGNVYCYSRLNLQNGATIHGETTFQNNVRLSCTDENVNNKEEPILIVDGVSRFNKVIDGTALRAKWGDVAELYDSDEKYPKGTLVKFGGEKEITIATDVANAVVSTSPGLVLNMNESEKMKNPTEIALFGRVPILIEKPVQKFDRIVLSKNTPGVGIVDNSVENENDIIAISLETKNEDTEKLVLCVVKMNFF